MGTKLSAIDQAEDRDLFKQLMEDLKQPIPESERRTRQVDQSPAASVVHRYDAARRASVALSHRLRTYGLCSKSRSRPPTCSPTCSRLKCTRAEGDLRRSLRLLKEDPWERLAKLRALAPNILFSNTDTCKVSERRWLHKLSGQCHPRLYRPSGQSRHGCVPDFRAA